MAVAPDPEEIYDRAVDEGERRLDQSLLELLATSFIAGFTIVFGTVALAIVHAAVPDGFGRLDAVAGALAFGLGVVFLVVGRAELFNENFFDPIAAAIERDEFPVGELLRLWTVTFALNLVGGGLMVAIFWVEGTLPAGTEQALRSFAEHTASRSTVGTFTSAIVGGALVALLSHFLAAVNSVGSRISMSYAVGFLLALGPFEHAIVTMLHAFFGVLYGAPIGVGEFAALTGVITAGNVVGGIGLVTLTHVAQALGARR
ncbi:formate/nitrite transporter family protein [Halorientalis halophila]|uniref:formate/nitrite transporter family protein n=1 Tax=Halorientalis halophila TaxID=3108499 RepID=UPI00300B1C8A